MVAQLAGGIIDVADDVPRAREEGVTGLGEHRLAPQAVEELLTELSLKIYNLLAQRWLSKIRAFRGPGEVLGLG
jgi:hypothetical protein